MTSSRFLSTKLHWGRTTCECSGTSPSVAAPPSVFIRCAKMGFFNHFLKIKIFGNIIYFPFFSPPLSLSLSLSLLYRPLHVQRSANKWTSKRHSRSLASATWRLTKSKSWTRCLTPLPRKFSAFSLTSRTASWPQRYRRYQLHRETLPFFLSLHVFPRWKFFVCKHSVLSSLHAKDY